MYTAKQVLNDPDREWAILDPNGKCICYVRWEAQADALLSHLNR